MRTSAHIENSKDSTKSLENYPNPKDFIGKSRTNHLILSIDCFKKIIMMLTTDKANQIREYYIGLEKLIKIYAKYQIYFQRSKLAINKNEIVELISKLTIQNNKLDIQNHELEEIKDELQITNENFEVQEEQLNTISNKLGIATIERAPRTKSDLTHGKFMLLRLNDDDHEWAYYVIRTQKLSINAAFNKIKRLFPNVTIEIEYQPNAINLFNLIKEKLKNKEKKIKVRGSNIKFDNDDYNHEKFLTDIKKINDEKCKVIIA